MFSPLAQGTADWDGGLQFEEFSNQSSPVVPLLPQLLIHHSSHGSKLARSTGSFPSSDGQIALPKTFVTRKGAIVLFTPSGELLNHENEESHLKKESVHELGVKLRTLGNLTHSVLEFGKEDEEAWEGVPGISGSSRESKGNEGKQKGRRPAFLRFLHYLDLENLTADKHVQPGADPDYYLEELRKSSGHASLRRFRSQTPFSTRTSNSNTYSHFLEDDEEITSIIREQVKYRRTEWSKDHMNCAGVVESNHIPDIMADGLDVPEDFSGFSPRVHRGPATKGSFHPSMPTITHSLSALDAVGDSTLRPKTAPIPPTLESPKANPRITSARPPPTPRALGTTPNHLAEILSAEVGFGRYHRKSSSPRLKLGSSPSPSVYPEFSRGATPDFTKAQHLGRFEGKGEAWNRAAHVIEEEDEASIPGDQWGAVNVRRPSSAGGSLESGKEETKMNMQRRASSAGAASRTSRASLHSSRSGSVSSLSYQNIRSVSAASRHLDHIDQSQDFDGTEREQPSPDWLGVEEELMITRQQPGADAERESIWEPATVGDDARRTPPFVNRVVSPSQVPRSPSVTSRLVSPSTRSPSAQSLRLNAARSRGSSASSSDTNVQWAEAAEKATVRVSSASSRGEIVASAQSGRQEEIREPRTASAGSAKNGGETQATQGSEADLAQVSETVVRSQSGAEGVYKDALDVNEFELADEGWPGATVQQGEGALGPRVGGDAEDDTMPELSSVDHTEESSSRSPPTVFIVSVEEGSDTASTRPADPRKSTPEIVDESPNLQDEEASSIQGTPRVIEKEAVLEKEDVTSMLTPFLETVTKVAPSNIDTADRISTESSVSVKASPVESAVDVRDGSPEGPTQKALDVPPVRSPSPLKADDILHTELLPSIALEIEGKVEGRQSPTSYKETIDIEKSRPSSPVSEEQRNIPVSVGEAVLKYIESGQEPQVRDRTSRSGRNSETGTEETAAKASKDEDETASLKKSKAESRPRAETPKTPMSKATEPARSSFRPKSKTANAGKSRQEPKPDLPGLNFLKSEETTAKMAQPSDKEREVRRQIVSGLLTKPDVPKSGKLELEGIGKEGEEGESASDGLVTRARPSVDDTKRDLSDLVALLPKNKTPNKKEKKVEAKKKSVKASKPPKMKDEPLVDPENIDFNAFSTPEMLNEMDEELRQFVLEQSASDDVSSAVNQPSVATGGERVVQRTESVQTLEVPQFAPDVPAERRDAHAPSKPKKLSKKELTKMRSDQRKEERKRKEEEKRKNEEEARLLKEREEEAARAKAEAEERQRSIEEEKLRRLEEEEEARREEEEALERLKDAKKKAREERETRRAAEAERRKLEVQKKREEKKKREEELREREKDLEQQKMDRERRKAEIDEARRRREEMERLEEEQRREEERLRALQEEEEQRRLEEERIREAEAELQRLQEEREYREQMRKIAENQEAKLRQEEEKRLRREEEELRRIEEENRKREEEEQERKREEQRRTEMARRLEALARMRSVQAAAQRKAFLLKRREQNVERMQHLKSTRNAQHITPAYTFTYFIHIPRRVWEVPIGFNKKKKAYKPVRRRKSPEPKPE